MDPCAYVQALTGLTESDPRLHDQLSRQGICSGAKRQSWFHTLMTRVSRS